VRLCARYRRLMAAGKRQTVVTTDLPPTAWTPG
jgi:hypothetical protein